MVGAARNGKSSTLNALSGPDAEPFSTSDAWDSDTRGVFIHTVGSRVLLDLEGTDLGQEDVIDQLSALAGLLASELLLFVLNRPTQKEIHYLLRFSLLMKNITRTGASMELPRLHVVVREPLQGTTQAKVHNLFFGEEHGDYENEARKELRACFGTLKFHPLPDRSDHNGYAQAIASLSSALTAPKSTPSGTKLDGQSLAEIVGERLFAHIRTMGYPFENTLRRMERSVCHRERDLLIIPLIELEDADEFSQLADSALLTFAESCRLPEEVATARELLDRHGEGLRLKAKQKAQQEELDRLNEELQEEKLKRQVNEQQHRHSLEQRQREEAEKEAQRQHELELHRQQAEQQRQQREAAEKEAQRQQELELQRQQAEQQRQQREAAEKEAQRRLELELQRQQAEQQSQEREAQRRHELELQRQQAEQQRKEREAQRKHELELQKKKAEANSSRRRRWHKKIFR